MLRLELLQLRAQAGFVILTLLSALTFLAAMSLFGLTGSSLPLAVVDEDQGALADSFVKAVRGVRHAFAVLPMGAGERVEAIRRGDVSGVLTIPRGFTATVARGDAATLDVRVDDVNTDMTSDLERSLPGAAVTFGDEHGFAGLRAHLAEKDLHAIDTPFLRYVAVSALGLDAFLVAGVLAALAMAREWEGRTAKVLRLSPGAPFALTVGKVLAASLVAAAGMVVATALVALGYGAIPRDPIGAALGLALCTLSSACVGACLGAWLKRAAVLVPLFFALAMPLYVDCGALEPTRFDGERVWLLAHASPLYYAQRASSSGSSSACRSRPSPRGLDALVLAALCPVALLLATRSLAARERA